MLAAFADTDRIEALAHCRLADCYQCGKCSAGCPVAHRMDLLPNQVLRLVQIGQAERAMRSEAIWQCVSCLTCTSRCPKHVGCAGVMDALRQLSAERSSAAPGVQQTMLFQKAFLSSVRRNGRLCEVEMIGAFKTSAFFDDLSVPRLMRGSLLAPRLMARGKFHLLGQRVKDRDVVRRIFERCESAEAAAPAAGETGRDGQGGAPL